MPTVCRESSIYGLVSVFECCSEAGALSQGNVKEQHAKDIAKLTKNARKSKAKRSSHSMVHSWLHKPFLFFAEILRSERCRSMYIL